MGKARKLADMANAPVFSAYASVATSVPVGAWTKISYDTEVFDTAACFASSRFTPTMAGYYQINASLQMVGTSSPIISIHKNGSEAQAGTYNGNQELNPVVQAGALIYMNGTTDYLEIYCFHGAAGTLNTNTGLGSMFFDGHLARIA